MNKMDTLPTQGPQGPQGSQGSQAIELVIHPVYYGNPEINFLRNARWAK